MKLNNIENSLSDITNELGKVLIKREKLLKESRDVISLSAKAIMNIHSSKDLPGIPLGIHAGVGYEVTSMTMRTDDLDNIGDKGVGEVKLRGQNGLRFIVGMSLQLWLFDAYADYEFGYFNAAAIGLKLIL